MSDASDRAARLAQRQAAHAAPVAPFPRTAKAADAVSLNDQVIVADATGTPMPRNVYVTELPGAGAFTAGVYCWTVTAVGPLGESVAPPAQTKPFPGSIAANSAMKLDWPAVPGATGYNIYRSGFNFGNITATDLRKVASVGNVTTWTDPKAAAGSATPPLTNGGSFSLALPKISDYGAKTLIVKAPAQSPNVVTLTPASGETIEGAATLDLGVAIPGGYTAVTLFPVGSDWAIVGAVRNVLTGIQAASVYGINFTVGGAPLAVVKCPKLIPGVTKMNFQVASLISVGDNTGLTLLVEGTDAAGARLNPTANIAYWQPTQWAPGEKYQWSASWDYDPRHGDVNLEDGSNRYIGLLGMYTGGVTPPIGVASMLMITAGPLSTRYWPNA